MPSQAEARLSFPLMMLLCSLVTWYFAVSYNVLQFLCEILKYEEIAAMTVYLASWYCPVKLLRALKVSQPQLCKQPVLKCDNPGITMQLSISEQNT